MYKCESCNLRKLQLSIYGIEHYDENTGMQQLEDPSLIKWKEGLWTPIRVDKSTWTFAPSAKEQPRRLIGSKEVTLLSKLIKRGIHFRKLRKEENYVKLKLIFTIVAVIRAT